MTDSATDSAPTAAALTSLSTPISVSASSSITTSSTEKATTSTTKSTSATITSSSSTTKSSSSTAKSSSNSTTSSSSLTSYTRGPGYGPASLTWTMPAGFPSGVFSSYYVKPVATAQPQPAIFDSFLGYQFPSNLTDPNTVPIIATDPIAWPQSMNSSANGTALHYWAINQMQGISNGSAGVSGNCSRCVAALEVGQVLAQQAPLNFTTALLTLCIKMSYKSTSFCNGICGASKLATSWDIIMQHADVKGQDGQLICNQLFTGQPGVSGAFCPASRTIAQSTKSLITKPKPSNVTVPPHSGKTFKVPHISDIHLDPRYGVGSEVSTNCGPAG